MLKPDYDLIVIGGGPGGYTAAIKAAQLGLKVALIEKGPVGGTCLNRGCIPTKAILESAKLFQKIKKAGKFGIKAENIAVDYPTVMARKNQVVSKLIKGVEFLLRQAGVEVIHGAGKLTGPGQVMAAGQTLTARNIILATGSEPAQVKALNIDEKHILTCTTFLNQTILPAYIIIIGGGVMGVEFASILAAFGVKVTMVEALSSILPNEDPAVRQAIEQALKKLGVELICGEAIAEATSQNGEAAVHLKNGKTLTAPQALVTIGRKLNTEGLAEVGIKFDGDKVATDNQLQTNLPGIYAIGDITGKYLLAHVAAAQGKVAALNCAGNHATMSYHAIPAGIFSLPEIGRIGLTEPEATSQGIKSKTITLSYRTNGRAKTIEAEDGFLKIIVDEKAQKIIGAHLVGENAAELIGEFALAMQNGITPQQFSAAIHPHPTLSEMLGETLEKTLI
jgi:dihydrolipoamide dehydrogenase